MLLARGLKSLVAFLQALKTCTVAVVGLGGHEQEVGRSRQCLCLVFGLVRVSSAWKVEVVLSSLNLWSQLLELVMLSCVLWESGLFRIYQSSAIRDSLKDLGISFFNLQVFDSKGVKKQWKRNLCSLDDRNQWELQGGWGNSRLFGISRLFWDLQCCGSVAPQAVKILHDFAYGSFSPTIRFY